LLASSYNPEFVRGLADNLRRERQNAHLTQRALAERAGVTELTVIKLELGQETNPKIATLQGLAYALGVEDWNVLLPRPDGPVPPPDTEG
jgi:transcriptional regulator with XRE-family HTH domain